MSVRARDVHGRFATSNEIIENFKDAPNEEKNIITRNPENNWKWENLWKLLGVSLIIIFVTPFIRILFGPLWVSWEKALLRTMIEIITEFPENCKASCGGCNLNSCWKECTCRACYSCLSSVGYSIK